MSIPHTGTEMAWPTHTHTREACTLTHIYQDGMAFAHTYRHTHACTYQDGPQLLLTLLLLFEQLLQQAAEGPALL